MRCEKLGAPSAISSRTWWITPGIGVSPLGRIFVALGLFLDVATYAGRAAQGRYQGAGATA